jgi:nicotinamidase/pyrazinamidase
MGRQKRTLSGRDALVVIDVQNDFVSGTMAVPEAKRIIEPINRLAEAFETVIVVQDWHPPGHVSFASAHPGAKHRDLISVTYGTQRVFHDHCVQGTVGAELDPGLRLSSARLVLRKGYRREVDSHSAFFENDRATSTGLAAYLRVHGVERLFCAGLTRYGCVMMSAVDALREGFRVAIVEDASEDDTSDPAAVAYAEATLASLGIGKLSSEALTVEGWVTDSVR